MHFIAASLLYKLRLLPGCKQIIFLLIQKSSDFEDDRLCQSRVSERRIICHLPRI